MAGHRAGRGTLRTGRPRSAPNQARELIGNRLGITDFIERETLDVALVDSSGQQVHAFLLLFVPLAARPGDYSHVRDNPPAGCTWWDGDHAGLICLRPGPDRLTAIATTVAELHHRYGLGTEVSDLGFEKLWEWFGADRELGTDMVAQFLLMAVQRAEALGLTTDNLVAFLRSL